LKAGGRDQQGRVLQSSDIIVMQLTELDKLGLFDRTVNLGNEVPVAAAQSYRLRKEAKTGHRPACIAQDALDDPLESGNPGFVKTALWHSHKLALVWQLHGR
jgi:hypothetical protein